MQTIRIGYQGEEGSNAQEAAKIFADSIATSGGTWVELIPLVTAERVFRALKGEQISLGVVATVNSLGGVVSETRHMLDHAGIGDWKVGSVAEHVLPIHHSLFTKKEGTDIKSIASHEQALAQTKAYRAEKYPDAREVVTIDTAYAASMLANGDFSDEVAIICRKDCGLDHGLFLVDDDIEDDLSYTVFHLLQGATAEDGIQAPDLETDKQTVASAAEETAN